MALAKAEPAHPSRSFVEYAEVDKRVTPESKIGMV